MFPIIPVLVLRVAFVGANGMLLSRILLVVAHEYGAPVSSVGRVVAAYGGGTGLAALVFGGALDRFGHGRALRLAMLAAALGQGASAMAPGWVSLTAAQALTGPAPALRCRPSARSLRLFRRRGVNRVCSTGC